MKTPSAPLRRLALCLSLAAPVWAAAPAFADAPPPHSPGTWTEHHYSFNYMGFTSTYSCDGLADKLKELLILAGARPDAKSEPGPCAAGFGHPDKFARADLTFYTLAPLGRTATSDVAADHQAGEHPVDGVWRPVAFAARSPRDLGVGDCELIEQFKQHVLPMFATRNVVSNVTCVPHELSGSRVDLRFDAFAAAPKVAAAN